MIATQPATKVDAFTTEVIREALVSITAEMKETLMRTAYNPIIFEAEDFTVGLFDAHGETISIGLGLPTFIRGLSDSVKAKIAYWGLQNLDPGDILLTNDTEVMGSHLNHLIFTIPIFNDGELVAFSSSMAHWWDIGGVPDAMLGGPITLDTFSEGLCIPFAKVFRRGAEDRELIGIIRANVRNPELAMGDFRAQVSAIRTGERRVAQLLARYGNLAFRESVKRIFNQSERLARAAVREIQDGVWEAESFMDDDGVAVGEHIPIKVRVIVQGENMTIDLSGISPQVRGYYNSGPTAGLSAAQCAFKSITTPLLRPINDGALRPLKVILPPGTVVSAGRQAPKRWWMTIPMTVWDTIWKALAPACPTRLAAGHHADLVGGGGYGATYDADGQAATICLNDGDTHNQPVEASEAKTRPAWGGRAVIVRRELRQDSGGAGRWRGGLGVTEQVEAVATRLYSSKTERTLCAPWGAFGGQDGLPNRIGIIRGNGSVERFPTGKVNGLRLNPGDASLLEAGGGGGFGDPLEREPWRVLADVSNEYVSVEAAEREYGVIVHRRGRRVQLDETATDGLRANRRKERSTEQSTFYTD